VKKQEIRHEKYLARDNTSKKNKKMNLKRTTTTILLKISLTIGLLIALQFPTRGKNQITKILLQNVA
jgi:hypothetical protein